MKTKLMKTMLSAAILAATTHTVWAAGTTAGTTINNTASISYAVGGNNQTPIESSDSGNSTPGVGNGTSTDFVVDKKIDLSVSPPATVVNVTPNSSGNTLTFQVTNEGNSAENFSFNISEIAGGDFDATGCSAAPATIASLAVDTPTNVVVTCSIPNSGVNTTNNGGVANTGTVANNKTSVIDLTAQVDGVTETTTADTAGVDVVFADDAGTSDALRDAKHSAQGTYKVQTADITVQKTSAVTKMSINGTDVTGTGVDNPKRIPGATVEYTISVSNAAAAGATATGIVITDPVPANMTYVNCTASGSGITGCGLIGADVVSTPAAPGGFSLAPGETATMVIEATVN